MLAGRSIRTRSRRPRLGSTRTTTSHWRPQGCILAGCRSTGGERDASRRPLDPASRAGAPRHGRRGIARRPRHGCLQPERPAAPSLARTPTELALMAALVAEDTKVASPTTGRLIATDNSAKPSPIECGALAVHWFEEAAPLGPELQSILRGLDRSAGPGKSPAMSRDLVDRPPSFAPPARTAAVRWTAPALLAARAAREGGGPSGASGERTDA